MKLVVAILLLIIMPPAFAQAAPVWPELQEFEAQFGISFTSVRNELDLPLLDREGLLRYRFSCRGDKREVAEDELLRRRERSEHVEQNPYVPWWPLTCVLVPAGGSPNLLASSPDEKPYSTRARIDPKDLVGPCASYPEHGRVRHFRLRGFVLTLSFADIEPSGTRPDEAAYAVMHVSVRRDPAARTAWAEETGFLDPDRAAARFGEPRCATVRKIAEPRMCRDPKSFSWRECLAGSAYEPGFEETAPYDVMEPDEARVAARARVLKRWIQGENWQQNIEDNISRVLGLVRQAVRTRDGSALQPILPPFPFALLCGAPGSPGWQAVPVRDLQEWRRLWETLLRDARFADLDRLTPHEAELSRNFGVSVRGGLLRIQDGLSVAVEVSCDQLGVAP